MENNDNIHSLVNSTLITTTKSINIFRKFDYLKLVCDVFFCLLNIYKLLIHNN